MTADADLLLLHGTVLVLDGSGRVVADGGVAVHGDRIVALGGADDLAARYRDAAVIDCRGQVVMPGLVDSYTHAGHGLIRGLFHPTRGWPAGDLYWHATTPAWWRAEARLAALERTRFGVTTAVAIVGATPPRVDEPIYALEVARANDVAGLRVVVGVGPPDRLFPHLPEPWTATRIDGRGSERRTFDYDDALEVSLEVIRSVHGAADGRLRACLAPPYLLGRHVPHRRTPHRLPDGADAEGIGRDAERMRSWAERLRVPIHTHAFRGSLAFASRYLGDAFVDEILGPDVVVAHANGLTTAESEALGRNRCGVAVVPTTHENVWYGVAPMADLLEHGATVSIASDGAAPYCSLDLWRELSRCSWNQWHRHGHQDVLPPDEVLAMVTLEAARALGLEGDIGSLEPGKKADIITVDLRSPHLTPATSIPHLLVHYASGADVDLVMVDGRIVKHGGAFTRLDAAAVRAEAEGEAGGGVGRAAIDAGPARPPSGDA